MVKSVFGFRVKINKSKQSVFKFRFFLVFVVVPTSQGLRRGHPPAFLTPRTGGPKRSDGGLVLGGAARPDAVSAPHKAGRVASPRRPRFAVRGFGVPVRSEIGPYQAVT